MLYLKVKNMLGSDLLNAQPWRFVRTLMFCGGVFLAAGCNEDTTPAAVPDVVRPVKVITAVGTNGQVIKTFPGVTDATRKTDLAFRIGGELAELPVVAGQHVKAGDLIARLDEAEYKRNLDNKRATYRLALTQYERQRKLFAQNHVSQSKLDEAKANFEIAEAGLKLAQDNVRYTRLTAPYDGIIAHVNVENFQNIQAKAPIAVLHGTDEIDINFSIPENIFQRMTPTRQPKKDVRVFFEAAAKKSYIAHYREHESVPDATTRSYGVTVAMPRPDDRIVLPGMSVNVEVDLSPLYTAAELGAVLVPVEALFEENGQEYVWVLDADNTAQKTAVTNAGIRNAYVQLSNGLKPGAKVIAAGVTQIVQGQKVRPLVKERGL
jgi:RND family efflux transporter MFP subunit